MQDVELKKSSYNRNECLAGIAHIGVGNFHRAHQALYIDKYLNSTEDKKWGIIGINLRKSERENFNNLRERKSKYILKTISTDGVEEYQEIQSIFSLYDWSANDIEAELVLSDPSIKIVTMTVTETGYYINAEGEINSDLEIIKDNVNKKEKSIIFSFLHNALNLRREKCNKPITLLCCDNIRENGKMLEKSLISYLKLCNDIELINWIETNVTFPSCMVDRITPRSPKNLANEISEKFKINEKSSVMAEPFIQWVIEDKFIDERPKLEKVGVEFVTNIIPYEEAKIRILNAGHLVLSYFGVLNNYKTYDQTIKDEQLKEFFFNFQRLEAIPALGNDIPFDLEEYMLVIFNRFNNENIADKHERLVMDGSSKFPLFVLPTIQRCFDLKKIPNHCIDAIASWYIFMKKIYNKELLFDYYEPQWEMLKKLLPDKKIDEFINNKQLWGKMVNNEIFTKLLKNKILELIGKY